jgi:REP element-mobilizing transposase RayT
MQKRTRSHAELFYHFVWSTKHRAPIVDSGIEAGLKDIFRSKAKELEIEIVEMNGTEDHVHLVVRSKATLAPADIAKNLKGASSHFVNHVVLAQDRIRCLYWQDEYGVVTVSPGAVRSVQQYIKAQKEHHQSRKLVDELEIESNLDEDDPQASVRNRRQFGHQNPKGIASHKAG